MNQPPASPPHGPASRSTGHPGTAGHGAPPSPLGKSLRLGNDDVDLLGRLFGELTASLGIDGGPIFARLIVGQSIGEALAVPDGVVERIYARAHRWFALGKIDRAAPLFRALCLLRDEDADFWMGYGVCMRLTGQFAKAQRAFETATNLRPDWAVPFFHLLELALHRKQWPQARAALAAYDARAGADVPAEIAAEAVRLRVVVEHGSPNGHADATPVGNRPARTAAAPPCIAVRP
ncbi:hypothetical protein ACUSIJ_08415 [Pseudochelatococcus sp. B33]